MKATRGMTAPYAAALRADFALILFRRGEDERAFELASTATRSRAEPSGRAAFAAGLAAWGLGHFDVALPYIEVAARAPAASAANRAAAAYWASRAAIRARHPGMHVPWLLQAAQEPRTFYGLMARRALGLTPGFAWHAEAGGEEGMAALIEIAGGWRAIALLQIGQTARAEADLRALWPLARFCFKVCFSNRPRTFGIMTGLDFSIASVIRAENGSIVDGFGIQLRGTIIIAPLSLWRSRRGRNRGRLGHQPYHRE
jgi:hypothetical protein